MAFKHVEMNVQKEQEMVPLLFWLKTIDRHLDEPALGF